MHARRVLAHRIGVLAVAAAASGSVCTASAHAEFAVTGYVVASDAGSVQAITRHRNWITDVGVDGGVVQPGGDGITFGAELRPALAAAHAAGRPGSLMLSNWSDAEGDFSEAVATRLLTDPAHRSSVAAAVRDEVLAGGWDGVTIDLEALGEGTADGLVAFTETLRATLPTGVTLDLDLPAGEPGDPYLALFDGPRLAAATDHLTLMAYDQHYIGGSAGPISGYPWFVRVVQSTLGSIDAAHLRVGVAAYGYWWRPGQPTRALSVRAARRRAGRAARWDARQAEWTARVAAARGGGTLWWSDRRSVGARLRWAREAGAAGAAVWELGSADRRAPRS